MKPLELAKKLNACSEATEFVSQFETIEAAWAACPRGEWMLWVAAKIGVDKRILVGVASKCVRTVQHLMKDIRSIAALDACDKFAAGEIDRKELKKAADAYAAYAAAATAAANATFADAKKDNQQQTANICREILTESFMDVVNRMETMI